MSQIKEVLFRNIEENIAPVIYFHQLSPETARQEVSEYVFTTRPSATGKQQGGIHEQMVSLLNQILKAYREGHKLPASWISGFFGSGKSSFAKLLGLALDKMELPDGQTMDKALMERDDTPQFKELHSAIENLFSEIDSMAVIFDIGSAAKNNESIPHTIYRNVLQKLGYSNQDGVAHFELALESEGLYSRFLELYEQQYQDTWQDKCHSALAPKKFRAIYKMIFPEQDELLETSTFNLRSLNIQTMVNNLMLALDRRAPGKTVFIVVDEVSQYIADDQNKMLDLQSFVSEIGGKAKSRFSPLWLLVTGQEKLEEESKDSVLFKLKDRFPEELRVHLDRANVREVVSRRILKKKPGSALDSYITPAMLDALKLHAYGCESITKEELIEHYPLLPHHIPLFMDITQNIRNRSIRTQSDAGGVRSVLNNIWDLFNAEPVALKDREIGTLLSLDMLYDIIGSSIDSDVQLTLHKVFEKKEAVSWESKVIKAIALLEMDSEKVSVTKDLLASLLYPELGVSSVEAQVDEALQSLKNENWIHFHEKNGWAIQNNAAQEWNRTKSEFSIPSARIIERLIEVQKDILSSINQPVYENARFPLEALWGKDQKILGKNDPTKVTVHFHWETNSSRRGDLDSWINQSRMEKGKFHVLSGETTALENKVREYERSQRIISRYQSQGQLQPLYQQLLYRERAENDRLLDEIKKDLRQVWLGGKIFFNGDVEDLSRSGSSFDNSLKSEIEQNLVQLFHKFSQGNIVIQDAEYRQLLERDVSGLSTVFFEDNGQLGIAQNDVGKILFRCKGQVPSEIYQKLEERTYLTGEQLINLFGAAPFGYSSVVIKSCVIGLLREERLKISDPRKSEITSIQDPGARSVFEQNRDFLRSELEVNKDDTISGRDRIVLRKFFENSLGLSNIESDSDALADLVFRHFPEWKDRISNMQNKINSLGLSFPQELIDLNKSISECLGNRQVQETLKRFKRNLESIQSGIARIKEMEEILNEDTEKELRKIKNLMSQQVEQLKQVSEKTPVLSEIQTIAAHMEGYTPWRGWADIKPLVAKVQSHYEQIRHNFTNVQLKTLNEQLDLIKVRPDFADIDQDRQQEVLQLLKRHFLDIDPQAIQPTLLQIKQAPQRIREASSEAHKLIDEIINEESAGTEETKRKISPVKLSLRNRIIESPEELDLVLQKIREKCMRELESGAKVRLEE
jgi:hypothetical protein